jgi:hypothetical protein
MDALWTRLAEQVPVVISFIIFAALLFEKFLKEIARKDEVLTKTLGALLDDSAKREVVRDDKFIKSFKDMTIAHNKGLARLAGTIKKCEAVEMLKRKVING